MATRLKRDCRCSVSDLLATERLKSGRVLGGLDHSMVKLYSRNCVRPLMDQSNLDRGIYGNKQLQREYQRLSAELRERNSTHLNTYSLNSTTDSVNLQPGCSYLSAVRAAFKSPYYTSHQSNSSSGTYTLYRALSNLETNESLRNQLTVQLNKLDESTTLHNTTTASVPRLTMSHGIPRPEGINMRPTTYLYKPKNLGYR